MDMVGQRIFIEVLDLQDGFSKSISQLWQERLEIKDIQSLRMFHVYDILATEKVIEKLPGFIMEYPVNAWVTADEINKLSNEDSHFGFGITLQKGQFDSRAEALKLTLDAIYPDEVAHISSSKYFLVTGDIKEKDKNNLLSFTLNSLDEEELDITKDIVLPEEEKLVWGQPYLGFIESNNQELGMFHNQSGLSMSFEDLVYVQDYFINEEERNPTELELMLIDTYWSDHCRHTTFFTGLTDITFEEGPYAKEIEDAFNLYRETRKIVYKNETEKPISLMDLATLGMKFLTVEGKLTSLEDTDEHNACSVVIEVDVDGETEDWLLLFKNETHNHPTEIEPYGGAATCLGGAIRDPLSGRGFVYQAMRITGSANPKTPIKDTLDGKLPQWTITTKAMEGYASYANQVGVPAGLVKEFYHDKFVAKRLEMGAVLAAAKKENVSRRPLKLGDLILLLGGETGRDGVGGATGSSMGQTEDTILEAHAEVQKGNPSEERKIMRLFKDEKASKMILRSNDFGAGGAAVAIGELAEGVLVRLDNIKTKYEGLSPAELALSESQERMAVVIDHKDKEEFLALTRKYDVPTVHVATVNSDKRLTMFYHAQKVVSLSREFLDSFGSKREMAVTVGAIDKISLQDKKVKSAKDTVFTTLSHPNVGSQKGLIENFDTSLGRNIVFSPFGGKTKETPENCMIAKIPVDGQTQTVSMMSYGYDPYLSDASPYHGGMYAVVDSVSKLIAGGCNKQNIYLSFQEYFERLEKDPVKWGKPFAALLGAFKAQEKLKIAAIGGKDSMSGTFGDIHVPPTLISVSVGVSTMDAAISRTIQRTDTRLLFLETPMNEEEIIDFDALHNNFDIISILVSENKVHSMSSVGAEGVLSCIATMTFGNQIGVDIELKKELWKRQAYGSFIIEVSADTEVENAVLLGHTTTDFQMVVNKEKLDGSELLEAFHGFQKDLFPSYAWEPKETSHMAVSTYESKAKWEKIKIPREKVKVLLPIFRGSVSEYDFYHAFKEVGAEVEFFILQTGSLAEKETSLVQLADKILDADILVFQDAYSFGDHKEAGGKLLAALIENSPLKRALEVFINETNGLILGVGAGMQTLLKLGLLPFGKMTKQKENSPVMTRNLTNQYISTLANVKLVSNHSPWLSNMTVNDLFTVPIASGESRVYMEEAMAKELFKKGQIPFIFVDERGEVAKSTLDSPFGSDYAIAGILSPDGRILGVIPHIERMDKDLFMNTDNHSHISLFADVLEHFESDMPDIELAIDMNIDIDMDVDVEMHIESEMDTDFF